MNLICLDMEGVLTPEVWVAFANKTGIQEFKRTTRDEPNYGALMQYRLDILKANHLKLKDIQNLIQTLEPLEGAKEFLETLRQHFQLIILSDTFYEFAMPFMEKLKLPTLFCHRLETNDQNEIIRYHFRQENQKAKAVEALKSLNYTIFSAGDSYNDLGMLKASDRGFFFNPPENVKNQFPEIQTVYRYNDLLECFFNAEKEFQK